MELVEEIYNSFVSKINYHKITEQIKYVLTEEHSISKEVVDVSNKLSEKINGMLKKKNFSETNIKGIYEYSHEEIIRLFGYDFLLNVNAIFYSNKKLFNEYEKTFSKDSQSNFSQKRIVINVDILNGTYNISQVFGTVQHEIEHIYQMCQMGKDFLTIGSKSGDMYLQASKNASSNDKIQSIIGKGLYYSYKFEVDANINGLYQLLHKIYNDNSNLTTHELYQKLNDSFQNSAMYIAIDCMNNALNIINTIDDEELKDILSSYSCILSKTNVFKRINNAQKYALRKMNYMFKLFLKETGIDMCGFLSVY